MRKKLSSWQFNADSKIFRLVSEAYRINAPHLADKFLAVHSSLIEPLPHQISAVYEKMLARRPLRFLLADDPGAGKTIMTGLLLKELFLRGEVRRCLIVCPGALVEQWQDELQQKFNMQFEILTREKIFSAVNFFSDVDFCIASMDILSRNKNFQEKLRVKDWDLIICDEAHKMSATLYGNEIKYTKRFRLGQLLGKITRNFLLLTATPHNGKPEDFYLFMSLIDPDRFEGVKRIKNPVDVSDMMRRLVKEDLLTFEGKPLFPERRAYTVNYNLSANEMTLYEMVTAYVTDGFNRAERLTGNKRTSVGFAMTILQRRLASSPKAIYKSLERRTQRLKKILREKNFSDDFDAKNFDDEFPSNELEQLEDEISERMTAARSFSELRNEIQTLERLTEAAKKIFFSGEDRKWRELSELLQSDEKFFFNGERDKLIIFTEHRDTLDYLQEKISLLFGRSDSVVTIHGGFNRRERRKIQEQFIFDKNIFVLIATDAAGEGINLQVAHLMINYDLPWNPNRLEQRFGRIHRIGQKKICHLWNLVAGDTREGQVFNRLLKKLEEERIALGGKVFDILGKISFDDKPLRELLIEAIRYGNDPSFARRLDSVVNNSFDAKRLQKIFRERALTNDVLGLEKVTDINQNMDRGDLRKLAPYFVENFFIAAFQNLGGQIFKRGGGRYEIFRVPKSIRDKALQKNFGEQISERYARISFDKDNCAGAELVTIGHPLLQAVISLTLENFGDVLRCGTIFIDDSDDAHDIRLLFCVETKISDGKSQILSTRVHYVEIFHDGKAIAINHAPYLNYSSPKDDAHEKILSAVKNLPLLKGKVEELAINYATENFIPPHLSQVFADKKFYLDKLEREVKTRLHSEINFWDNRAEELRKKDKARSDLATQRADDLADRLTQRLAEISLERKIFALPPAVVSGALIVPRAYVESLAEKNFSDTVARSRVEKIAMDAVTQIERELGNTPVDVSGEKCGYDIESREPDGQLRFIEVKGRNSSADTDTVTANEIITALNSREKFFLAIVMVSGNSAHVVYLKNPFTRPPDINAVSVNYKISALIGQGNVFLDRNIFFGGD